MSEALLIFVKVLIAAIFLLPLIQYSMKKNAQEGENNSTIKIISESNSINIQNLEKKIIPKPRKIIQQPSCPKSHKSVILNELILDLIFKKEYCTPGDFVNKEKHKIPPTKKNKKIGNVSSESRGIIVGYLAGGLLIASLVCALIELYKAKSGIQKKSKAPLSRKCSLADLTVLKHHRKELVRRESILELPEEGSSKSSVNSKPPLHRRCSFPYNISFTQNSIAPDVKKSGPSSLPDCKGLSTIGDSRRPSIAVDPRRASVVLDTRRPSLALDVRKQSVTGETEVCERRHHARLVHRH